jgi:tRNA A-37 threonylcarbamoyl transferase component Bud32
MSDWPLSDAYVKILQNPKMAFKDPVLQACNIRRDGNNQPLPMSGAFAVVFQAVLSDGSKRAVRAFTTERPGIADRYRLISEHLSAVRSRVPALVDFHYEEKGIRAIVRGKARMYPLVTMDWVPGITLFEWVHRRCTASEKPRLHHATEQWAMLVNQLASADLAHGDLQHANILVNDTDQFKLVDYDCMCVPKLVGQQNMEIGVAPYQHRERDGRTCLNLSLDNFSAMFIYVALRALAAEPRLWTDYVVATEYEKLLFREEDFDPNGRSPLFQHLKQSPDKELARLSEQLFHFYQGPLSDVPPLREVLISYDKIRTLLDKRQFDEAVQLLERQKDTSGAPADLQPRIQNAFQRVACLRQLQPKVQSGDEQGMQQFYKPALLDDFPAAQGDVAVARLAGQVIPLLAQLGGFRQQQKWRSFVQAWDTNRSLLEPRKSAQPFRPDVDHWRPRNQACDAVLRLAAQPACDPDQLQQAWSRLRSMGGHPEIDAHQAQIERLIERGLVWKGLQPALAAAGQPPGSEQADRQLVGGWNVPLFAGWDIARQGEAVLAVARQRLQIVDLLEQSIAQAPVPATRAGEQGIEQAGGRLPPGYQLRQRDRVQLAQRRRMAAEQATAAAQRRDELALDKCWAELQQLQAQGLVDAQVQQQARAAQQRAAAWTAFQTALGQASATPGEHTDSQLDALWNESLFRGWTLAEQQRPQADRARARLDALKKIDQSLIALGPAVTAAGEQNLIGLAGQLPSPYQHRHAARVAQARQRCQAAQQFHQLAQSGSDEQAICDAWLALQRLQATPLVAPAVQQRGQRAEQRLQVWQRIEPLLGQMQSASGEALDNQLLQLWDEPLLGGWPRADAQRTWWQRAEQNRVKLQQLRQAATQPLSVQNEQAVVQRAAQLPPGYQHSGQQRVEQARQRIAALQRLGEAVRQGNSENAIVDAANLLNQLQAQTLVDPATQRRVGLAAQRVPLLAALQRLDRTLPLDQYDEQIRRIWQDNLLNQCPQARPWLGDYQTACHRHRLVQQLAAAVAARNEPEVARAICDPAMAGYPLPDAWRGMVEEIRRATLQARQILEALQQNRPEDFCQAFDAAMIRRCQYLFTGVQQRLADWTRQYILAPDKLLLRCPVGRRTLEPGGQSTYRARWAWPENRMVEKCEVGIFSCRLAGQEDPRSHPKLQQRIEIDGATYTKRGCTLFWNSSRNGFVYVWALIDLGFCVLSSPPLDLGPLRAAGGTRTEAKW